MVTWLQIPYLGGMLTVVNKVVEGVFHRDYFKRESVVSHKLSPLDTQNENAEVLQNTRRTGNHGWASIQFNKLNIRLSLGMSLNFISDISMLEQSQWGVIL